MYVGGEIAELAAIGRPEIGVVTAVHAGPPVADRDARGDRAGEGRARRGAAGRRRRDPQRRRRAGPPDGGADARAGPDLRLRAGRRRARRGGRVARRGRDALRARRGRRAAPPVAIPTLGRLAVHNALAAAAVGLGPPGSRSTVIVGGARAAAGRAPHRGAAHPRRRRDDRRRLLQRVAGLGDRGARAARRPARPADRRARRDARARRRARGAAIARVGEAAAAVVDRLVVVGEGAARDRRGARDGRARRRTRSSRSPDRAAALAALRERRSRRRRRPRQGVARRRARPPRRRPRRGARRPGGARPMTVELIQGLLLAFAIVVILMPPYIRLLRSTGLHQADPDRGTGEPPRQARHADDGRRPDHRRRPRPLPAPALAARGRHLRPARRRSPGSASLGAFDDYLNAKTGEGISVRQKLLWQVVFAIAAAFLIQRTYADRPDRGAVRRRRHHRPGALRRLRGLRDHRREQRREHHRRPRRARRRHAHLRVRRVPDRRAC